MDANSQKHISFLEFKERLTRTGVAMSQLSKLAKKAQEEAEAAKMAEEDEKKDKNSIDSAPRKVIGAPSLPELLLAPEVVPGLAEAAELSAVVSALQVCVVKKGPQDMVCHPEDPSKVFVCGEVGSLKRPGGLGAITAGTIACLLGWANKRNGANKRTGAGSNTGGMATDAAHAGCVIARVAAQKAYARRRRSMAAKDVLDHVGATFEHMCPADEGGGTSGHTQGKSSQHPSMRRQIRRNGQDR